MNGPERAGRPATFFSNYLKVGGRPARPFWSVATVDFLPLKKICRVLKEVNE